MDISRTALAIGVAFYPKSLFELVMRDQRQNRREIGLFLIFQVHIANTISRNEIKHSAACSLSDMGTLFFYSIQLSLRKFDSAQVMTNNDFISIDSNQLTTQNGFLKYDSNRLMTQKASRIFDSNQLTTQANYQEH